MMMMMMNSKNRTRFDKNTRQEHRTMLYRNNTNDDDDEDEDDDDLGGYRCVVRDCRDCDCVIEFLFVVVKDGTSTIGIDDGVDWFVGIRLLFVLEEVVVVRESVVIVVVVVGEWWWWCDFRFHGSIGIRIVIVVVVRSPLVHSW